MNDLVRIVRTTLVFLGSTALIFLGIRFLLSGAAGAWSIPASLVFMGAGGMTWVARRAFSSDDPQKRFIGVGAIAANAFVAFFGWSIGADADTDAKQLAAWMILGIVLLNVLGLLAAIPDRHRPAQGDQ